MIQTIQRLKFLIVATIIAAMGMAVVATASVSAQSNDSDGVLCSSVKAGQNNQNTYIPTDTGVGATSGDCGDVDNSSTTRFNGIITQIINIFTIIVGVVSVIFILIGGFRYITSGGDSGNVSTAKNTILYALVGLVIVALAQFIVRFVVGKTTNIEG